MKRIYIDGKFHSVQWFVVNENSKGILSNWSLFSSLRFFSSLFMKNFFQFRFWFINWIFSTFLFLSTLNPKKAERWGESVVARYYPSLPFIAKTILFYSSKNTTAIFDYLMADHVHSNSRDSVNLSLSHLLTRAHKWKRFNE